MFILRLWTVNNMIYKHNVELQRADPGTKVLGALFSHTMLKIDFLLFPTF